MKRFRKDSREYSSYDSVADVLFNKKHAYEDDHQNTWELPSPDDIFSEPTWTIQELQDLKSSLNEVKSQLNDYPLEEWSRHTAKRHRAGSVHRQVMKRASPELCTRAWLKFFECASAFDNVVPQEAVQRKSFNSVHICEAPGAFIASLNHFLKLTYPEIQWKWMASSLNPYHESNPYSRMISDDRFIIHTLDNWEFGADYTGDLMNVENIDAICERARKMGMIHLVTADGSIDCSLQPDVQEEVVAELIFWEAITALRILAKGGNFIMKLFTAYEEKTLNTIYMLCCCFSSVTMFKPFTSKEGNSEVYLICLDFRENFTKSHYQKLKLYSGEKALFSKTSVPSSFIDLHKQAALYFYKLQCAAINDNIETYNRFTKSQHKFYKLKEYLAHKFIKKYQLLPIESQDRICVNLHGSEHKLIANLRINTGTFKEKRRLREDVDRQLSEISAKLEILKCNESIKTVSRDELTECPIAPTFGKKIDSINSSQFIMGNYLSMYNKICDLTSKTPFEGWSFSGVVKKTDQGFDEWEKKSILSLLSLMDENVNENLIIESPVLLTQFTVGLLYFIAYNCCQNVVFDAENHQVRLESFAPTSHIKEIKNFITENIDKGKTLLGVISLKHFRLTRFSSAVYSYNCRYFTDLLQRKLSAL